MGRAPLVGRGVSRGGCGLREALGSFSVDGWDGVPCGLFGLKHPSPGAPRLLGGASSSCPKQDVSLQMNTSGYVCHQLLCPKRELQPPSTARGDPPRSASKSPRLLMESLLLRRDPVGAEPRVPSPRVDFSAGPVVLL